MLPALPLLPACIPTGHAASSHQFPTDPRPFHSAARGLLTDSLTIRRRPGATTGKPANLTNQPKPKMTTILENLRVVTGSLKSIPLDDLEKFETLELGPEWLALLKSGLTIREIMCLQNVMGKSTLKKIGAQIGVTRERIRQSRERALRRLRHPKRKRLARIIPPQLHLAVYGKLPANHRQP